MITPAAVDCVKHTTAIKRRNTCIIMLSYSIQNLLHHSSTDVSSDSHIHCRECCIGDGYNYIAAEVVSFHRDSNLERSVGKI